MRLGYIVKCFPRLSETFILTEILELERLGCEVTIFSRYTPTESVPHGALGGLRAEVIQLEPLLRDRFWESFEVHYRLSAGSRGEHEAVFKLALGHKNREEMRYWLLAGPVAELATARGIEWFHAHFATGSASVARYASRLARIPFSFTSHAKDIYAADVDGRRLRSLLEEADVAVTISEANRAHLGAIAPAARIARVYNGIDLSRFPLLPALAEPDPPQILSVARMVEKKGLSDLIAALAILHQEGIGARCRLVGTGPVEPALREQARTLGLEGAVEFHGLASQEEVASIHLPAASVFALPCIVAADGDRDGLPTTLLEAMARGVPVVSTRLPGIAEAIPEETAGLLVDPGDTRALAQALARSILDRSAAARRAACARRHVEALFDSRINARQLLKVLQQAREDREGLAPAAIAEHPILGSASLEGGR